MGKRVQRTGIRNRLLFLLLLLRSGFRAESEGGWLSGKDECPLFFLLLFWVVGRQCRRLEMERREENLHPRPHNQHPRTKKGEKERFFLESFSPFLLGLPLSERRARTKEGSFLYCFTVLLTLDFLALPPSSSLFRVEENNSPEVVVHQAVVLLLLLLRLLLLLLSLRDRAFSSSGGRMHLPPPHLVFGARMSI